MTIEFPIYATIAFILTPFALLLALIICPRSHIRRMRHAMARLVMWQWKTMSLISTRLHRYLWRGGDGKGGHP